MGEESASERIYEDIQRRILNGSYAMGSKLVEDQLARDAGISRTPVREALRRLTADGLVVFEPHRGARVASLARTDLLEIYSLRAVLESHVAAYACERMDYPTIDKLNSLALEMELANRDGGDDGLSASCVHRLINLNTEFHNTIMQRADSPWHARSLIKLLHTPLMYRTIGMYSDEELARSHGHHRELIAAFVARDPEWASSTMRSHILAARATLLRSYGDRTRLGGRDIALNPATEPPPAVVDKATARRNRARRPRVRAETRSRT
jgi:DNA-binding GntR family transcriptional regulator